MSARRKYIICLGDGMADLPLDALDGKTPLESANTPNLDRMARSGATGLATTVPKGEYPGSDVANMGILGYDPRVFHTGRAPIEAASMGIDVPDGKIAFRCNLVYIENGRMADFTAGHIPTEVAEELLAELREALRPHGLELFTGVSYRHIALIGDELLRAECTPPHDISDQEVAGHLPRGDGSDELNAIAGVAAQVLERSAANRKRVDAGERPANSIWLWGQGTTPRFEPFRSMRGVGGGLITAVDIVKGIGKLAGLEAPDIPGATGFIDTDYEAKIAAAFEILDREDFVYIHVEAPDEAGHMGDAALKTRAIEDFDTRVIGPVLEYARRHPSTRVLVLPDHPTPCSIRTHTGDDVPILISGDGVSPDDSVAYNESSAENGSLRFTAPWDLLETFLAK